MNTSQFDKPDEVDHWTPESHWCAAYWSWVVDCEHVVDPLPVEHHAVDDGWIRSLAYDRRSPWTITNISLTGLSQANVWIWGAFSAPSPRLWRNLSKCALLGARMIDRAWPNRSALDASVIIDTEHQRAFSVS